MYHEVTVKRSSDHYAVTLAQFEKHLDSIRDRNLAGKRIGHIYPDAAENQVCITFDDGYLSDVEIVLPRLKAYGMTATFFLSTGLIGKKENAQTWEGVETLLMEGMDVQVHGHKHVFLDSVSASELERELGRPREILKEKFGHRVEHLSLPGGRYNNQTIEFARRAGYESVSTSIPGVNKIDRKHWPYLMKRNVIHQGTEAGAFYKMIEGDRYYSIQERGKYELKKAVKKGLGNKVYQAVWERIKK